MSHDTDSIRYNYAEQVSNSTQYNYTEQVSNSPQCNIAEQSQEARLISSTQDDLQKALLDDDVYQSTRESWNTSGATSRHD
ncbi:unnamed protein product [Adineta steineri]|uniref:Uncharacterized protein n=1 Tax=Adineta steineri TaxID=433720 RepID=A0A815F158_9BILA|nr:unnamed protein product [Adineta steineri]CAF3653436.1 unnamed protein product [Adineta steineri]